MNFKKLISCVWVMTFFLLLMKSNVAEAVIKDHPLEDWGTAKVVHTTNSELRISNGKISAKDLAYEKRPWIKHKGDFYPNGYTKIVFDNVQIESNNFEDFFKDMTIESVDMSKVSLYGENTKHLILDSMFENCSYLKTVLLSDEMVNSTMTANNMFSGATKLKEAPYMDFTNMHSYTYMYKDTKNLEYANISTISPNKIFPEARNHMFEGSGIKSIEISSHIKNQLSSVLSLPESSWLGSIKKKQSEVIPTTISSIREAGYGLHRTTEDLIQNVHHDQEYAYLNGIKNLVYTRAYSYSVDYHSNDGMNQVISDSQSIRVESELFRLNDGKTLKNKNELLYWNTKPDGSGERYLPGQMGYNLGKEPGETVHLYAEYRSTYTIKYLKPAQQSDIRGVMSDSIVDVGQDFTIPDSGYTRKGYNFTYWSTIEDMEYYDPTSSPVLRTYQPGRVVKDICQKDRIMILYPQWMPITYSIEFNGNGGEGTMENLLMYYNFATELPKETFTRKGYSFVGWSTDAKSKKPEFTSEASINNLTDQDGDKITLYAIWEEDILEDYMIKYDANVEDLSTISGTMKDQSVAMDQDFRIIDSQYSRVGYTFSHWTTTKEDTIEDQLKPGDIVKNLGDPGEEVILYAQWTPIHYSIKFNDMDMDTSRYTSSPKNLFDEEQSYDQNMVYDKEDNLTPIRFSKKGYTNRYWKQTNLITFLDEALVKNLASNEGDYVDLYTEWRPHVYTIDFNANGGTGSMGDLDTVYDSSVKLPKETFTRKNYVFVGWSTDAKSKKPEFTSEAAIKNLTDKDGDKVTLYAIWEKDRFAIDTP